MCAQLALEANCKRTPKKKNHLIFIHFGAKKFIVKNTPKNKTLMFECYNLIDPKEYGAAIF
jgi:hypothetical protein